MNRLRYIFWFLTTQTTLFWDFRSLVFCFAFPFCLVTECRSVLENGRSLGDAPNLSQVEWPDCTVVLVEVRFITLNCFKRGSIRVFARSCCFKLP